MPYAHRNNDSRICGAVTEVKGQDFVKINGELWAVDADPNSHGAGELIHSRSWITIDGRPIIVVGDSASPDVLCFLVGPPHCGPDAVGSANFVDVE